MKRDTKLWRLILRQVVDGAPPPDLASVDEQEVVYNSALLVEEGFVDGQALRDGNGQYVSVAMLHLTNKGHDLLEKLEAENQITDKESHMSRESPKLSIFISHSSQDEKLAAALVDLIRSALNIPANRIRCTSVDGYRLPVGAETENRLRQEVHQAKVLIGLITPSSIASAYVMFELGARWGAGLPLVPLLGSGAGSKILRGPLASLNALNCGRVAEVHQLVSDVANYLGIRDSTSPAAYQELAEKLVEISNSERPSFLTPSASTGPSEKKETDINELFAEISNSILNSSEVDVLKLFAGDSKKTSISDRSVADMLKIHPLKAEHLCERLGKLRYLTAIGGSDEATWYEFTRQGRDYLVEHDLLPPPSGTARPGRRLRGANKM